MFKYADYVYEIYKEKSFTKAAKNLFVSQPALSATVKKLEEEMQVQIFDRSTNPLGLTPEGEAYIRAIEEIFNIKKDYENYIIDVSKLNVGSISVSGANFISSYVLPKIIVPFSKKYPRINIELLESNSKTLVEDLINEKIELLIDYNHDSKLVESYPLFNETVLLCVPSKLELNNKLKKAAMSSMDIQNDVYKSDDVPKINVKCFENEKFLMMKTGNSMNYHGFSICHEADFEPSVAIYFDQLITAYNMTASGLGVCFVTDTLVKAVSPDDNLLFYKIDSDYAVRTVHLIHKKKRYLNRAVREFINVACEVYGVDI